MSSWSFSLLFFKHCLITFLIYIMYPGYFLWEDRCVLQSDCHLLLTGSPLLGLWCYWGLTSLAYVLRDASPVYLFLPVDTKETS